MTCNKKLKALLKSKGVKKIELSRACDGLHPATVNHILSGAIKPGHRLQQRIIKGLKKLGFSSNELELIK